MGRATLTFYVNPYKNNIGWFIIVNKQTKKMSQTYPISKADANKRIAKEVRILRDTAQISKLKNQLNGIRYHDTDTKDETDEKRERRKIKLIKLGNLIHKRDMYKCKCGWDSGDRINHMRYFLKNGRNCDELNDTYEIQPYKKSGKSFLFTNPMMVNDPYIVHLHKNRIDRY